MITDDEVLPQIRSEANTIVLSYLYNNFREHGDLIAKFVQAIGDQYNRDDVILKIQEIFTNLSQLKDSAMSTSFIDQVNALITKLQEIISGLSEEGFKSVAQLSSFGKERFEKKLASWKRKINKAEPNERKDALSGLLINVEKLIFCIPDKLLNLVNNSKHEEVNGVQHKIETDLPELGAGASSPSQLPSEIHPLENHQESFISHSDSILQSIHNQEDTQSTTSSTQSKNGKKRLRQTKLFDVTPNKDKQRTSTGLSDDNSKMKQEFEPDCTLQGLNKYRKTSEYYSENKYTNFITDRVNGITTCVETSEEEEEEEGGSLFVKLEKTEKRKSSRRKSRNSTVLSDSAARSILSSPTKKSSSRFWSEQEMDKLEEGYRRFSDNWTKILKVYSTTFHTCRTPAALKDKFLRTLAPKFKREEEESYDSEDSEDSADSADSNDSDDSDD